MTTYKREPNTQYILSLSYGKDSLACLEAIKLLGLPLDRIVHAEVWATDTIPADLPPMVDFKTKADKIILDRYGIKVEHICAMKPVERERERERESPTKESFTDISSQSATAKNEFMASRAKKVLGATQDSKWQPSNRLIKDTYEQRFYKIPKRNPTSTRTGVYGFPISRGKGNWCTELKTKAFLKAPCRAQKQILYNILASLRTNPNVSNVTQNLTSYFRSFL